MSASAIARQVIEADVVAIGAGRAAIPFVHAAADGGRSAVLVERSHLGGSCVNYGCTPSKAALASAQHASDARNLARFGVVAGDVTADFPTIMMRARGSQRSAAASSCILRWAKVSRAPSPHCWTNGKRRKPVADPHVARAADPGMRVAMPARSMIFAGKHEIRQDTSSPRWHGNGLACV